jgi:hypothetical protein
MAGLLGAPHNASCLVWRIAPGADPKPLMSRALMLLCAPHFRWIHEHLPESVRRRSYFFNTFFYTVMGSSAGVVMGGVGWGGPSTHGPAGVVGWDGLVIGWLG